VFPFEAIKHISSQPHHGRHNLYLLPDRTKVILDTNGRLHQGTVAFSFKDRAGHPCDSKTWARDHDDVISTVEKATLKGFHHAKGEMFYAKIEANMKVELTTNGRAHEVKIMVVPKDTVLEHPPSWCNCWEKPIEV
jgi:hypothetical protein